MATTDSKMYIGEAVPRKEDPKLLTGQGRYTDDLTASGMVWMAVVRSPHAHAKIKKLDLSKALEAKGVVAAFSGEDLAVEWAAGLPCAWPVTEDIKIPDHWPIAKDKARFAGDGVAVVVADSRVEAKDAVELVEVAYEPLPAVTDVEAALEDGAPIVHDDFGTNHSYTWSLSAGEVDKLFSEAEATVKERYVQQRLIPNAIEPRSVLVQPIPAQGEFTIWTATQIPHIVRFALSAVTGVPEAKLRVIAPEVGGGFGSKLDVYAEEVLCLALARRLGVPIKWTEERSEAYLATIHGRDVVQEIELAASADGKITAVRTKLIAAMGAYMQLITPGIPILGAFIYSGAYEPVAYQLDCLGVFTNTTPTDAYRGAGRPESTYAIERAVDALAREIRKDPIEIRRLNFIKEFPATIASGLEVDSGDYEAALDQALELVGYDELRKDQAKRNERGDTKRLGIGVSTYLEMCGLAPSRVLGAVLYAGGGWDAATIRMLPIGTVQVVIGTSPHGQSHVTTVSQIVAERLGISIDDVEVLHGDTAVSQLGWDTYGSRSLAVGGVAVYNAAEKIIDKARTIVAHQLEASEDDLDYESGTFTVKGTDKSMTVTDAGLQAWTAHNLPDEMEPGLEETYVYDPPNFSWPAGTHIAVVEVDTETGAADLIRYVAVDDVGTVINPTVVEGQVQGGVTQGVAQALFEEARYDETGNLRHGSMTSYLVPSAAEMPNIEVGHCPSPSPTNPMGVKGVGETGTIASPAATMSAVIDALAPLGVTNIDMPASPERVWRALQEVGQ